MVARISAIIVLLSLFGASALASFVATPCVYSASCQKGVSCYRNQCGSGNAPCSSDSQCASGTCGDYNLCTFKYRKGDPGCIGQSGYPFEGLGIGYNNECETASCGTDGICGGVGAGGNPNDPCDSCTTCFAPQYVCAVPYTALPGDRCAVDEQCAMGVKCLDRYCGGVGACHPDNKAKSGSGASANCGYDNRACINYQCATLSPSTVGALCYLDSQCPDTTCSQEICGGVGATCTTDTLNDKNSGSSKECASNLCLNGKCQDATAGGLNYACSTDADCLGAVTCASGTCGGIGAVCTSSSGDGTKNTGDTAVCSSKTCVTGFCAPSYYGQLSSPCSSDAMCSGDVSCGPDGTCGGMGAQCIAYGGKVTGTTTQCTTHNCVLSHCAEAAAGGPGSTCTSDDGCANGLGCSPSGLCGYEGTVCSSDTGFRCATGYICSQGAWTLNPGGQAGDPCRATADCASPLNCLRGTCSYSTTGELGDYCDSSSTCPNLSACRGNVCGGTGGDCSATEGGGTGSTDQCLSGHCVDYGCISLAGDTCRSDGDCAYGSCSSSGICGAAGTGCSADDNGVTGTSRECMSSTFILGDQDIVLTQDYCLESVCTDSTQPGQSSKAKKRQVVGNPMKQDVWMIAQCSVRGEIACPVVAGTTRNGYEVRTPQCPACRVAAF